MHPLPISPALAPTTTVGELAATRPSSTRVFFRRGIDFCCGGGKTLEEVCRRRGLDPQEVLWEIQRELEREEAPAIWTERSQAELIQHIIARYHEPLREELHRLHGMALKVLRVHGEKDPERLSQLADTFSTLKDELLPHLDKEERILFPWILSGSRAPRGEPEHQGARSASIAGSARTSPSVVRHQAPLAVKATAARKAARASTKPEARRWGLAAAPPRAGAGRPAPPPVAPARHACRPGARWR